MKIHEYQAKEIFSKYGIPVERHTLCRTAAGVIAAYRRMGTDRVVIKAQVLTGGRGKAGGVKLVSKLGMKNLSKGVKVNVNSSTDVLGAIPVKVILNSNSCVAPGSPVIATLLVVSCPPAVYFEGSVNSRPPSTTARVLRSTNSKFNFEELVLPEIVRVPPDFDTAMHYEADLA